MESSLMLSCVLVTLLVFSIPSSNAGPECLPEKASKHETAALNESLILEDSKMIGNHSVADDVAIHASLKTGTDLTLGTCGFNNSKGNECPCNSEDMTKLNIETCTMRLSIPYRSADGCPHVNATIEIGRAKLNQPTTYHFVYEVTLRNGTVVRFSTEFNISYIDPTTVSTGTTAPTPKTGGGLSTVYYGSLVAFGAVFALTAV